MKFFRSVARIGLLILSTLPLSVFAQEQISQKPVLPNGREANAPFKPEHRMENWSTFGLGNCVVASCCQNAKFSGHPEWAGTFKSLTNGVPGGHYPEKLEKLLQDAKKKHPELRWVQFWGQGEAGYKELLAWNAKGFPVGITWGTGTRYGNRPIAHMVSLVHADEEYWMIADNNFIEEFSTVPSPEGRRRWAMGSDEWGVVIVPPDSEWPQTNDGYASVIISCAFSLLIIYFVGCCCIVYWRVFK